MLDNYSSDFEQPNYKIPENKFNSEVENETDPKLKFIEGALKDLQDEIEDERVLQARALVQESYVEKPLPKPEIIVPLAVRRIHYRGKGLREARRSYLHRVNSSRNIIHKIIFSDETEGSLVEDVEIPKIKELFRDYPSFKIFYACNTRKDGSEEPGGWFAVYDRSDSANSEPVIDHFSSVLDANSQPVGILKCSSEIHIPNTIIPAEEVERLDVITARIVETLAPIYQFDPNQIPGVDTVDSYSANKAA